MSDILKAFGTTGQIPTGPNYTHPLSEDILRECSSLLMEIPEGRRLLKFAKDKDINFHVITGREPGYRYGDPHNVFLVCPANTKAVDLDEMAVNLGLAIHDAELPTIGSPHPTPGIYTVEMERVALNHILDIIIEMCKISNEFVKVKPNTKLIDLIEKLGHAELNRGIGTGKSKQELAEVLEKSLKN